MDFRFFESLTDTEALEFLNRFIAVEEKAVTDMVRGADQEGIQADFTISSVPSVLKWVAGKLKTFPRQPDETLPSWITKCESYARGLFDFSEPSKVLVLRAAYYLGDSFVRDSSALSWSVGNCNTAEKNMPVITGFRFNLELAPILVVENLFRRMIADDGSDAAIDLAMNSWLTKIR